MDVDINIGFGSTSLATLPRVILKRILAKLDVIGIAYLARTLDKGMIARISEGRMIDELRISLPPRGPQCVGSVLFLLSMVSQAPRLVYIAKGALRSLSLSMIQRLYRLDCEYVVFQHQPEVPGNLPLQFLGKARRSLNLALMFPHLKGLELRGLWEWPGALLDMVRSLPNGFQSFNVDWTFKSFQTILLGKVFDCLPLSTTSISALQITPAPKPRKSPDPVNFYDFQTRLPELAELNVPFDALLFDAPTRVTNPMPPQLWTTTLTALSLRVEDLTVVGAYAFPASLRFFNLLVSTHHEAYSNIELGNSSQFPIILQSLPYTLEELIIRNPPGARPSFDIGDSLPSGLIRLTLPPTWMSLLETPSRIARLTELTSICDSMPFFGASPLESILPSPANYRLPPSPLFTLPLSRSLQNIDFASTTLCRENVPLLPQTLSRLRISINSLSTVLALAVHCKNAFIVVVNEVIVDEHALEIPEAKTFDTNLISMVLDHLSQRRLSISSLRLRPKYVFSPHITHLELISNQMVKSVGAKFLIPILDPSSLSPLVTLAHLTIDGSYELSDGFWKALPSTLTHLDTGASPLRLIFDTNQLPFRLVHYGSTFHIDRNKIRWCTLPRSLKSLHVPWWEVDEKWAKRVSSVTSLKIAIDKINDIDLKKFVRMMPGLETLKVQVMQAFFVTGRCIPPSLDELDVNILTNLMVQDIEKSCPNLKSHDLARLILTTHGRVRSSVRWQLTSSPSQIQWFNIKSPLFEDPFSPTSVSPRWKLRYIVDDEADLKFLPVRSFRAIDINFARLDGSILPTFNFSKFFRDLVIMHLRGPMPMPKNARSLSISNLPPSLTVFDAPHFNLEPFPDTLAVLPKLAFKYVTMAGGHRWNETRVRRFCTASPSLVSLVMLQMVLNGTYFVPTVKTVTWPTLFEYARTTMPLLAVDRCFFRFRAKLPAHMLSIDLTPHSSCGAPTSRSHTLFEQEWTLPQTLALLPHSLTALHIQSKNLRIFGDEFNAALAPSLLRLSLNCKCILNNDWPSVLPPLLAHIHLPSAVCRNGKEPLQIAQFSKKTTHLLIPLMLLAPPLTPQDLPSNLARLEIAKPWPDGFIKAINRTLLPSLTIN